MKKITESKNPLSNTLDRMSVSEIVIRLNDNLINMDEKVQIIYRGKEIFNGLVHRKEDVIVKSIEEYGDPKSIYFGEISISLNF